jgi:hypothetical protein
MVYRWGLERESVAQARLPLACRCWASAWVALGFRIPLPLDLSGLASRRECTVRHMRQEAQG